MDFIRAWVHAHPAFVQTISLIGLAVLLVVRVRSMVRRGRAPVSAARREAILSTKATPLETLPLAARVGRAALRGLAFPGVFSLLILVLLAMGGRYQVDRHGTKIDAGAMFVFYALGSAAMGAILGVFWPRLRSPLIAIPVGWLAAAPLMLGINAAINDGLTHWDTGHTVISALMILGFGAAAGLGARRAILQRDGVTGARPS